MSMNRFMQPQQKSSQQQQCFQQQQQNAKQHQQQRQLFEQEQHDPEHMATLHAKLRTEADKIRKWKIQTEMDLKEKDQKLSDAHIHIEKMRKSLLELQLSNESAKGKLKEEMTNREEIFRRVDSTRKMCNLLQFHAAKMEEQLNKCEKEKDDLKSIREDSTKHTEELRKQFELLQLSDSESLRQLKEKASQDRNKQAERENQLKIEINEKDFEIKRLMNLSKIKSEEVKGLKILLKERDAGLEQLEACKEDLEKKVSTLSTNLETKEAELKEASLRIISLQKDHDGSLETIEDLRKQLRSAVCAHDELSLQMKETSANLEQRLQSVIAEAKDIRSQLECTQNKLDTCESELKEMNNQLEAAKTSRDSLMKEKTELELQLHDKLFQLKKCQESEAVLAVLEEEKKELSTRISHVETSLAKEQDVVQQLRNSLSDELTKCQGLQENLDVANQMIDKQSKDLTVKTEDMKQLQAALSTKEGQLLETTGLLEEKTQEAKVLEDDLQKKDEALKASNTELETLKSAVSEAEDVIKDLRSQIEKLSEESKSTGKSLTVQQKKVTEKLQQNKGLEKQVKDLTKKLGEQHKICKEQHEELCELKEEIKVMDEEKSKLEEKLKCLEEEMKDLLQKCQQDQADATAAMAKAEELQESARKEKEAAIARSDSQLTEMMATLDNYRQNNERQVMEKEKELQAIKCQLDKSEKALKDSEKDLQGGKSEIEGLHSKIASISKEKETLQQQLNKKSGENTEMKEKISHLEQEMNCLELQSKAPSVQPMEMSALGMNSPPTRMGAGDRKGTYPSTPIAPVTPCRQQSTSLQTPRSRENLCPRTPKTPVSYHSQQVVPKTPATPRVLTSPDLKTPGSCRSRILRPSSSVTKRRKVAFQQEPASGTVSSSEESDLMELDPDAAKTYPRTPLLQRTPYTPSSKSAGKLQRATTPAHMITYARHTPSRSQLGSTPGKYVVEEPLISVKTPKRTSAIIQKTEASKTPNVRKAPPKAPAKIFTSRAKSPATKAKSKGKTDQAELSWFDIDSVFGFGPED